MIWTDLFTWFWIIIAYILCSAIFPELFKFWTDLILVEDWLIFFSIVLKDAILLDCDVKLKFYLIRNLVPWWVNVSGNIMHDLTYIWSKVKLNLSKVVQLSLCIYSLYCNVHLLLLEWINALRLCVEFWLLFVWLSKLNYTSLGIFSLHNGLLGLTTFTEQLDLNKLLITILNLKLEIFKCYIIFICFHGGFSL